MQAAGSSTRLVPADQTLAQWLTKVSHQWSGVARPHDLGSLRDLRSAYACDRYEQLTGAAAPVVAGERVARKADDKAARAVLSQELGHNRTDVLAAYIGSAR